MYSFFLFNQETNTAYGDTLNKSSDELFRLLLLLDYSTVQVFFSYSEHVTSVMRKALNKRNIEIGRDYSILFYSMSKEEALQLDTQ